MQTENEATAVCELHKNVLKKDLNPDMLNQRVPESNKIINIIEGCLFKKAK